MHELYEKAFAMCRWETSSMSIDEASTTRARGIFTTRRCADVEDVGQAIPWQGEELVLAGLCSEGHSLCPGSAIRKLCDVCKLHCPRTAWSWECQRCYLDVCPACMAAFGPLVLDKPREDLLACGMSVLPQQLEASMDLPDQSTELAKRAPERMADEPSFA
eukprot:1815166-Amphidinium_carterae.1